MDWPSPTRLSLIRWYPPYSESVTEQLRKMPFAPSAQKHVVPPDVSDDDFGESDSDLETRLTRQFPALSGVESSKLTSHDFEYRTAEGYVYRTIW